MKRFLKTYFNKTVMSGIAAPSAITGIVVTAALFAMGMQSGSPVLLASTLVTAAISAGYVNKWKQAATGSLLWKPRTPIYGL